MGADNLSISLLNVDVELPDDAYGKPDGTTSLRPNQILGNDIAIRGDNFNEDEISVTIQLDIEPQVVLDNMIDQFSFSIASSTPHDFMSQNGTLDKTDFIFSNGQDPIEFTAKFESLDAWSWDDPLLQTQPLDIEVQFSGQPVLLISNSEGYNPVTVNSRFSYLAFNKDAKDEAIDYARFKFRLSNLQEDPEYDPSETGGAAGITKVGSNFLTSWIIGVYLGDAAFTYGANLASVITHEESHVSDGAAFLAAAIRGQTIYDDWVTSGYTESLSSSDVSDIRALITTEIRATSAEQNSQYWSHLSPDLQSDINNYQASFEQMEDELLQAGY